MSEEETEDQTTIKNKFELKQVKDKDLEVAVSVDPEISVSIQSMNA